jgi:hypothetical protein
MPFFSLYMLLDSLCIVQDDAWIHEQSKPCLHVLKENLPIHATFMGWPLFILMRHSLKQQKLILSHRR